jgi:hypothetical protein
MQVGIRIRVGQAVGVTLVERDTIGKDSAAVLAKELFVQSLPCDNLPTARMVDLQPSRPPLSSDAASMQQARRIAQHTSAVNRAGSETDI